MESWAERFNKDADERNAVILVANCRIEYWGRSRSVVDDGDRIIILKPDNTIIVHSLTGFKPLNWMSPPSDLAATVEDGNLQIFIQKTTTPHEEMKIKIKEIQDYRSFSNLTDPSKQKLTHTEKDMRDYLAKNPQEIDPNFRLKHIEYRSPLGFFDLYGKIGETYVVVELKAERAGLPAALQTKRYLDWLKQNVQKEAHAILIAPAITENALTLLRKEKIGYQKFNIKKIPTHKLPSHTTPLTEWTK
ncbi:Endonuclease NucS [uncultured archaeon]|nr:Endonuclease NucS [uncultured archaeon]